MTISLNHPLSGAAKLADPKHVEAALASLSYWTVPKAQPTEADQPLRETALEQMYAYFA